ncbi:uncharacterized protein LOC143016156 [Genypterus blacodes]|uniref:uncharacterized protein LOC143016156 n=1 Tax=Genypterus blacodes TaxID=154954 RepID=UPI003F77021F
MDSLVGYGGSSESDSDGDVEDLDSGGLCSAKEKAGEASADKKTRNFLLASGSASSESTESEPEEKDPSPSPRKPRSSAPAAPPVLRQSPLPAPSQASLTINKLPPPPLGSSSDSGVFANPFKAQADQKLSALQKHVPLTMQAKPAQIGGKRICVSYRKDGRCRFGIKCKYAHDSDLQSTVIPTESRSSVSEETPASPQADSPAGSSHGGGAKHFQQDCEEASGGQQGKKRRVGLSNTLIPPKRAMKRYAVQRDRERLNMAP